MSNRREFVAAAGGLMLTGLGTASTSASACAGGASARRVGGSPSLAAFQALQGEDLVLRDAASGKRSTLQLIAVRDCSTQPEVEQFSLILRGKDRTLTDGLYTAEHAQSGRFAMRLDASGTDGAATLYRADFSLLV